MHEQDYTFVTPWWCCFVLGCDCGLRDLHVVMTAFPVKKERGR